MKQLYQKYLVLVDKYNKTKKNTKVSLLQQFKELMQLRYVQSQVMELQALLKFSTFTF